MWDAPIGLVDGGDATRQSIFLDAIQYNAIAKQPMAQCNIPVTRVSDVLNMGRLYLIITPQ